MTGAQAAPHAKLNGSTPGPAPGLPSDALARRGSSRLHGLRHDILSNDAFNGARVTWRNNHGELHITAPHKGGHQLLDFIELGLRHGHYHYTRNSSGIWVRG